MIGFGSGFNNLPGTKLAHHDLASINTAKTGVRQGLQNFARHISGSEGKDYAVREARG